MSRLIEDYLDAAERMRWTPATFLKRKGHDFVRHHAALICALDERVSAGRVVAVSSKNGGIAYLEVIE